MSIILPIGLKKKSEPIEIRRVSILKLPEISQLSLKNVWFVEPPFNSKVNFSSGVYPGNIGI